MIEYNRSSRKHQVVNPETGEVAVTFPPKQNTHAVKQQQQTCRCDAYPFPHRQGGGDCKPQRSAVDDWLDYSDFLYDTRFE